VTDGPGQVRDALHRLAWLRQPSRFAMVGAFNTALDFAIFSALVYGIGLSPVPSNVTSYSAGVIASFFLNRRWTFATASDGQRISRQFANFLVVNILGVALSTMIVWIASQMTTPLVAKFGSTIVTLIWNYCGSLRFVFRDSRHFSAESEGAVTSSPTVVPPHSQGERGSRCAQVEREAVYGRGPSFSTSTAPSRILLRPSIKRWRNSVCRHTRPKPCG
jgi:putative flippase GtrA